MCPSSLSDIELLVGAKQGNSTDWEELVDRHYPKLKGYLSAQMHDSDMGTEITHETFITAQLLLNRCSTDRPFLGWLFRIAQNHVLRARRYEATHSALGLEHEPTATSPPLETSDIADTIIDSDSVKAALSDLSPRLRKALLLHIEGFKACDIAQKLNISIPAAEKRISRAKQLFRLQYTALINDPWRSS